MKGLRMRELREIAGLKQNEVAPELGLHKVTICRWELSDKEIPKVYGEAFTRLVNDVERVAWIKSARLVRNKLAHQQRVLSRIKKIKG